MISVLSIRLKRVILVFSLIAACVLVLIGIGTVEISSSYYNKEMISSGIQSLTDKFDFSYLQPGNNGSYNLWNMKSSTLEQTGFIIEPNNVQFKFTNPLGKKGTPQEIQEQNDKRYAQVFDKQITEPKDFDIESIRPPADPKKYKLANATIIALVRNNEASSIGKTIRRFEKKFNDKFHYPYTFLNDEPFTDAFKSRIAKYTDAPMEFVTVGPEFWKKPSFIDETRQKVEMDKLQAQNIAYATMESYHNMCRFYLGMFYNLPELQKYKYYWRIEPNVNFYTDIKYDVFKYLQGTGKKYGFTINLYDIHETVVSLWPETLRFLNLGNNYKYVNKNGAFQWLLEPHQNPKKNSDTGGYSTCHFWSNFEIADMDFYRSEAYNEWFKHLDRSGGFYYERWGDAPVHSLGLSLFADKKDIHWFRDIGYFHDPYFNCPKSENTKLCSAGRFSRWDHLNDQNCMSSWIDYSIDDLDKIY